MKEYLDHVADLRADYPEFAAAFGGSDSLENVLGWMKDCGFPPGSVDMVSQDEFSYDLLLCLAAEDRWLVFGVN